MNLFKLKPARPEIDESQITNLDAIIAEDLYFQFKGRLRKIRAITTKELLKVTDAMARISKLQYKGDVSVEEIIGSHYRLITAVCDDITLKEVNSMTPAQIAGLNHMVMTKITGGNYKIEDGYEKKKTSGR